jgi:flagellar assembly protein FliH
MSAPAKFLFDLDFAAPRVANTIPLADHQVQMAEAQTHGYAKGFAAGQQEAEAQTARHLAQGLQKIGQTLTAMGAGLQAIENRIEAEAVEVAVAVAGKLAATLVAREPLAEIEALVRGCFRQLTATPHVVVRVGDALYPHILEKLDGLAAESGFAGRLVVLAEPDIRDGDCRIEWADGGMTRDTARTEAAIAENVGRFVAALRAPQDISVKGPDNE